jgi:site-specific DNA recombinase
MPPVNTATATAQQPSAVTEGSARRAIGVVRISRVGDRTGETFVSPDEQRERIRAYCEREGLELADADVLLEQDVSGGAPLAKRPGLRRAVEAVEAGEAEVVVVAYFDRLVRSLTVQAEVVGRVEAAGGAILAVDIGQLTNGSAGQWLSGTMLGAVAEYHRRATAERTDDAKRRAVERGVPPFPNVPPGYRRGEGGRLEVDPATSPTVAEAFRLRAEGATIKDVRAFLRAHGIDRSFHGVQSLLGSRIVLGELRFGDNLNERAHPALIDEATWRRVQKIALPRGRRPVSERLLARLGVLRCGTCGARMVIGSTRQQGKTYAMYRCPPIGDCKQRVTISANMAEAAVAEAVQTFLADVVGNASIGEDAERAARDLDARQSELDAAIRAFTGLEDEQAARDRLATLRAARDTAQDRLADLAAATGPALTVTAGDWDALTLDERRALIRVTVAEATVAPGRGPNRITVTPRGE